MGVGGVGRILRGQRQPDGRYIDQPCRVRPYGHGFRSKEQCCGRKENEIIFYHLGRELSSS